MNSRKEDPSLNVYCDDQKVGKIWLDAGVKVHFQYDPDWLKDGFPISMSLPLRTGDYEQVAHNFFANLLPEGDYRQKIERMFQVSSGNDFSLLAAIGGDCAGVLSLGHKPQDLEEAYFEKITKEDLIQLIRSEGISAFQQKNQQSRLSLAGAQGKIPVTYDGSSIQIPRNGAPSTHIIKFNRFQGQYARLVENEYFMTQVAQFIGLNTISCELHNIDRNYFMISKRYDRMTDSSAWPQRLHQEDFCQAMGVSHMNKYEKEGGPSFPQCVSLVRKHLDLVDVEQLIQWFLFNLIMGNSDAHGKNLSILYRTQKRPELAPFYDLVCTRAYDSIDRNLAMALGGRFDPDIIGEEQFKIFVKDITVTFPYLKKILKKLLASLPAAIEHGRKKIKEAGVDEHQMEHVFLKVNKLLKSFQKKFGS